MKRNIELQVIFATVICLRYNTALDELYEKLEDREVQSGVCGAMDMVLTRWSIVSCAHRYSSSGPTSYLCSL